MVVRIYGCDLGERFNHALALSLKPFTDCSQLLEWDVNAPDEWKFDGTGNSLVSTVDKGRLTPNNVHTLAELGLAGFSVTERPA